MIPLLAFLSFVPFSNAFNITSYDVQIDADSHHWCHVSETITAYFPRPRHGLRRFLPTSSARYVQISVPHHPYRIQHDQDVQIFIGDPDQYVSGSQTYHIEYDMRISWRSKFSINVIGTEWETDIEKTTFSVSYPFSWDLSEDVEVMSGPVGSHQNSGKCDYSIYDHKIVGTCDSLSAYNGVTIAVRAPWSFGMTRIQLYIIVFLILVAGSVFPTFLRYVKAVAPAVAPNIPLSSPEIACLLNHSFCLRETVLALGRRGLFTVEGECLVVNEEAVFELPVESDLAREMVRIGPTISAEALHGHLKRNGDRFQSQIKSRLREAGLTHGWQRSGLWSLVFLGLSVLLSRFLSEWKVDVFPLVMVLVLVLPFVVAMHVYASLGVTLLLQWPLFCVILTSWRYVTIWESIEWGCVAIPLSFITFYAWFDSYWTPLGAELALHHFAAERAQRRNGPAQVIHEPVTAWDGYYYAPYCRSHGYNTWGDGTTAVGSGGSGGGGGGGCGSGGGGGGGGSW